VPTGLPSDVLLRAILWRAEAVIARHRRWEFVVHKCPVEQQVVVKRVQVREVREEPFSHSVLVVGDLTKPCRMVVRDRAD
jgi:hypothetical protein